jgi:hypothetical protein
VPAGIVVEVSNLRSARRPALTSVERRTVNAAVLLDVEAAVPDPIVVSVTCVSGAPRVSVVCADAAPMDIAATHAEATKRRIDRVTRTEISLERLRTAFKLW